MNKFNLNTLIFLFVVATIPLLSGADQPLIQGLYISLTLLISGIWLIMNYQELSTHTFLFRSAPFFIFLAGIVLTTVSLPPDTIRIISPVRVEALLHAIQTGQFPDIPTSLSYYRPGTLFYAAYGLTLFLLFHFSAALLKDEQNLKILLWIITIIGGVEALLGIGQAVSHTFSFPILSTGPSPGKYPVGLFSDHVLFAAFLNICWPVSLMLGISLFNKVFEKIEFLKIKNKRLTVGDWLKLPFHYAALPLWLTATILVSVILSGSASGILIMIIQLVLCRILIPFSRPLKILFSGTVYSAILIYGWFLGIHGIISGSTGLLHAAQARIGFWADTLPIIADHVYTGIGMGAFPFVAPVYLSVNPENQPWAHIQNDYIELAAEVGLPLILLLLLWLLAGLISTGRDIYRMPGRLDKMTRDEIFVIGAFLSLLSGILNAAADSIVHTPAISFYVIVILAVLHIELRRKTITVDYSPKYLFLQKKPTKFVPYRRPGRRPRR